MLKRVDAKELKRLLRRKAANHQEICLLLNTIARGVAEKDKRLSRIEKEDASQEATLFAINCITKYQRSKNAFSYFFTIIRNKINNYQMKQKMEQVRAEKYRDNKV